jgi:outer membrane lipoprotein SlyB
MTGVALVVSALTVGACAKKDQTNTPQSTPSQPQQVATAERGVLPVGQELDVRLQNGLSSSTAKPEQSFQTTTVVDLQQDGRVLVPAGSTVRGIVSSVDPATRTDRAGKMTLSFNQLTVNGQNHAIKGMATNAFESGGIRDEGVKAGAGGAVGGVIGGIIGGVKGALIGAAVGAGGVIAATEGKDVDLKPGTIIRLRLDSPVNVGR